MKTDTLKNISLPIATAMLLAMASYNLNAQTFHYRFTGTVEETDPTIPFTSLVSLPPGLTQVRAGDRVTGSFRINPKSPPSARLNGAGAGALFYKESVEDFRLEIGGRGLITFSVPGDETVLFNDWNLSGNNPFVTPPIYAPLDAQSGPQADGLLIHASHDQVQIGGGVSIKVHLNFTDSTASTVQRLSDTPTENSTFSQRIDLELFNVAKGFIRTYHTGTSGVPGILFNIDSLEEFEPTAPPPVELTTGYHVLWPSEAEGYVLEEAESANGPWLRSEDAPIVVEGQNIVVMDMRSRAKFYRLTKAN